MFIALLHHYDVDVLAVCFISHTEMWLSCLNWLDEDSFLPEKIFETSVLQTFFCAKQGFFLYKCDSR